MKTGRIKVRRNVLFSKEWLQQKLGAEDEIYGIPVKLSFHINKEQQMNEAEGPLGPVVLSK